MEEMKQETVGQRSDPSRAGEQAEQLDLNQTKWVNDGEGTLEPLQAQKRFGADLSPSSPEGCWGAVKVKEDRKTKQIVRHYSECSDKN